MNYLQFEIEVKEKEAQERLIALLGNQGFNGFEEEEEGLLNAYIPELHFDETAFAAILDYFPHITYAKTTIENINWNKQWEENFQPVVIGQFAGIRAGFHLPLEHVEHEIVITPKMSFGTGHHATTHMMVEQMKYIDFAGKTTLDYGTGTGVLAILAEKLGAPAVLAIDYDEWSITNTLENIALNSCSRIQVELADNIQNRGKFDVILANINLNVLLQSMDAIAAACNQGAVVLMSGFLKENEPQMRAALTAAGFSDMQVFQRRDWIALSVKYL